MVVVSRINPRRVGMGVVAWALVVDFCLFLWWTKHHAGISNGFGDVAILIAGALTVAIGFWLGWSHRTGTAFVAPLLAWIVVVPFAFASGFITHGFFGGLLHGFYLATVGGFVAAFIEGVLLVAFAIMGRISAAALGHGEDRATVILPPGMR
jgi:hypothetical protein